MSGSRKRLLLVGLLLLVVLVNGVFWFATSRADGGTLLTVTDIQSDQLIVTTQFPDRSLAVSTRTNEIIRYAPDLTANGSVKVDSTVGAIAPGADEALLVGSTKGVVTVYSADLQPGASVKVNGRVMGLAESPAGDGFYVAHGVGAFGVRFYISFVPTGATAPAFTFQVGQPITALVPWQDGVLFGTGNSQVGYFTQATPDKAVWSTLLKSPISRISLADDDANSILVGDEKGGVAQLDANGSISWQVSVGQYAVRGLNRDAASGQILAGDANGTLSILGEQGSTIYQGPISGTTDLEAIVPTTTETGWVVIPRSGTWQSLDPAAAQGATSASNLRLWWMIANGLLAIYGAATAIALVDRWNISARRTLKRAWRARMGYLFAVPAVALIALFSYYPSAMAIYYSFTNYSLRSITHWVGFDNYQTILFDDPYFRTGIKNMVILTLTSVIKTLTVPLLIAELIFWLRRSWHAYLFRTLFILPTVVPGLVFTLMWRQIYDPDTGLLNEVLGILGLDRFQRAWLGDPETALWSIIGVGFPWVDAFALLILLGGLLNISGDYFDAAKVDGAGVWQRFRHVDLPLLVPQFRILLFFAIAGTIQGFVSIFILTRGGPGRTTYIPALQMYNRIADGDFGYASAVGVILFLLVLVMTFIVLRFRRNDGIESA